MLRAPTVDRGGGDSLAAHDADFWAESELLWTRHHIVEREWCWSPLEECGKQGAPTCEESEPHRTTNVLETFLCDGSGPYREGYKATFYHDMWQAPEKEPRLPFKWKGTNVCKKIRPSKPAVPGLNYASLSKLTWEEIELNLTRQLEHLEGALLPAVTVGEDHPKVFAQTLQEHKDQGHVHYRRDCGDCLAGAGRARPHRRVAHPEPYVLSMDLAGPLRKGLQKEKYFLVAAYILPESEAVGQSHEEDQEEGFHEGAPDPSDPFDELPASDEEAVDASYLLEDQPKELEPLEGDEPG